MVDSSESATCSYGAANVPEYAYRIKRTGGGYERTAERRERNFVSKTAGKLTENTIRVRFPVLHRERNGYTGGKSNVNRRSVRRKNRETDVLYLCSRVADSRGERLNVYGSKESSDVFAVGNILVFTQRRHARYSGNIRLSNYERTEYLVARRIRRHVVGVNKRREHMAVFGIRQLARYSSYILRGCSILPVVPIPPFIGPRSFRLFSDNGCADCCGTAARPTRRAHLVTNFTATDEEAVFRNNCSALRPLCLFVLNSVVYI